MWAEFICNIAIVLLGVCVPCRRPVLLERAAFVSGCVEYILYGMGSLSNNPIWILSFLSPVSSPFSISSPRERSKSQSKRNSIAHTLWVSGKWMTQNLQLDCTVCTGWGASGSFLVPHLPTLLHWERWPWAHDPTGRQSCEPALGPCIQYSRT